MTTFIDRIDNPTYKDRLNEIDREQGDNFADLIDTSIDYLEFMEDDDRIQIFLCALFAMPLPYSGAADELIAHLQSLAIKQYCIADCGCAGGQLSGSCAFEPDCPNCREAAWDAEAKREEATDREADKADVQLHGTV